MSGNLATTGAGAFSLPAGGTVTMTGASKTISGFGISIDNLTIPGSVSTASSLTITGNLNVTGSFVTSAGVITMSGAGKTITGAGAKSFASLYVTGGVTTNTDLSISSALNISGTFSASAGTVTFTSSSTLTGRAGLFNARINGTSLKLASASVLGIASALTISAGTLDVTSSKPNTVEFNGTGAQNVNAIAYDNLVLSNGNIKTALAGLTIYNDITIAASTQFAPGNFTHAIYGDWYNYGTFTAGLGTVEFIGGLNAHIYGATTFNVLTVNNTTSATTLTLHNNVEAAIVNMVSGTMLTGSNTIKITNTRTGDGIILGNINRTHAFTTGVAYAFEGPNNSILFSSVSGVNSITVSVTPTSILDFPYNAAISRLYEIVIPAGTYNATLRLHYEDAELNGNNENAIVLWNYSGSFWLPFSKSGNSTTLNYVEQLNLTNITGKWTCGYEANVAEWNGSISSDWHVPGNWTILQGAPSRPPSVDDVAVIGYSTFNSQPAISTAVNVKNIVFGSAKPVSLSMSTGGSLLTGDIVGIWSGNGVHNINVNNQTVSVGNLALSDGVPGRSINLNIGNGTLNVLGSLYQFGGANVSFSGAGNLAIRDDYNYTNGTFTAGAGTVTYNGSINQTVAPVSYNNLTINKVTSHAFIADSTNIAGNLSITGDLEVRASTVIGGNVNIQPGALFENYSTLRVGGDWNNNGNYQASASNTRVIFNGAGPQNISATTFNNLEIAKPVGSIAVLTGDVVLKGDLVGTSGTLDIKSFFFNRDNVGGSAKIMDAGTLIIGSNNAPNKFSNYSLGTASTVIFNGTGTQHLLLPGVVYGNITFRNTGTKILYTPIDVKGDLTIESGSTFDGGAAAINLYGNWLNSGTYLPSTSTVAALGTSKNISGNNTFHRITVSGSYTFLNNNTINDLLRITSSGSLSGGSSIVTTMNGDLINSGTLYTLGTTTFTGNVLQTLSLINAVNTVAVTVNFNGTVSPVLNSTSAPQYGFLNINNTGGINASVGYNILYGLSVGAGASFNTGVSAHNIYGYLNNAGTITGTGNINFLPATATSINMGTNFSNAGRVTFGGAGQMTVTGNPLSMRNVTVSNTHASGISVNGNWTLTNSLTVNAGSIMNAGANQFYIGGFIDNRGTINAGTSTFRLNGSLPQTVYSPSPFYNLQVETNTDPITLLSDVTVGNQLNFVKGSINTGVYKVIQPEAGIILNASQSTGWINGTLQKAIAAGATLRIYQVGDANYYTPATLSLQEVTSGGTLAVSSIAGDHPQLAVSRINVNKSVNRYWKFTNAGLSFTNVNIAFKHPVGDLDAGTNSMEFGGSIYNDINWQILPAASSNDSISNITTSTLSGDFAIGEVCNKNTSIAYSAAHFCSSASPVAAILTGNTGGVFSAPAGLSINATNGTITPSTSVPGEYKVTYLIASTGECAAYETSVTVFIEQAPQASFSYANGPYCSGAGVVYPSFTGTIGGSFSANAGLYIDPLTGRIDLSANQPGSYTVSYTVPASGGCGQASFTAPISIVSPGKWTGAISSHWFDAGNWMCGIIPATTANVSIDSGAAHYPVIDTGVVTVHNLSVAHTASVKITQGALKLTGVISNAGVIDATLGILEFAGTVPQTLMPGTFMNNAVASLIISNVSDSGLVLASPLDVYTSLTFSAANTAFTTNDFLTLKSTSIGTARVGNMTGVKMTGNVTVENYVFRKAWHFLSIPTNTSQSIHQSWQEGAANAASNPAPGFGTQITTNRATWQTDGFDAYSASTSIKKYDGNTNSWLGTTSTKASNIKAIDGYMVYVRGDRTITATSGGSAPTVLRTKGLLFAGNLSPVPVGANKMVSVGNPFVAPLDLRKLSKTGVKDFFYVWDPYLGGNYGVGGYQVFTADSTGNYVVVPGGGSYGASGSVSNFVRTGLAFFAEGDNTGGYINFTEGAKFDPADPLVSSPQRSKILVSLLSVAADSSTAVTDGLLVNFDNNYSNAIDNGDAVKYTNAGENIATLNSSKSFIVERRAMPAAKDTIYMKVSNLKVQKYRLSITASQLDAGGRTGTLIDAYTGTRTALQMTGNTMINFTVDNTPASYANNRFKIVFEKMTVLPVKFVALKAYSLANNSINVEWQTAEESNTSHYEIERSADGSNFSKIASSTAKGLSAAFYNVNDEQPLSDVNYYRIKAVENSGQQLYSNIVKVSFANKDASLSIYPNPATDGFTSLQLNNMPKGSYAVSIVSQAGQVVYSTTVENAGRSTTYSLDFGKTIAAGIYQVITIDPNGVKRSSELMVK
ncbi:MAG: T9SS type A sorting domain-containing protein [Chitinophagaceae bacterium]|nr:MAG: T9SS type A sorting domain-containing protein [Chitinophagaceae bacterium]